ncbi:MAG: cytoplasmic filament protein CfpA, partial [Spirochaetaceae bacterium]
PLNIRENIKKIIDMENIRNRGFNTAINSLTSILDTSKMGYQYIENLKNARELVVREYEDMVTERLPDERYQMRLKYYDAEQLAKEQQAYDQQMEAFTVEISHLYDVVEAVYQSGKSSMKVDDFDDLAKRVRGRVRRVREERNEPLYEDVQKTWNEIVRIRAEETDVEKLNRTYLHEKNLLKKMLGRAQERIQETFGFQNPKSRVVLDARAAFLEKQFEDFDYLINPYHIQPGLLLDVDITSIKRKKFTLNGMANVLNEFLHGISKGFQDAAFASFKRRRSTVREDLDQSFSQEGIGEARKQSLSESYYDQGEQSSDANVKGKANVTPPKKKGSSSGDLEEL